MARILLLQPGQMGTAIGSSLVAAGNEVCWMPAGRSASSRRRAEDAGFLPVESPEGSDVVISVLPPDAALETASAVQGFRGIYVDANAVSPATARRVAEMVGSGGATYVDGGIVGAPPARLGDTRLYLCGDRAGEVAALFAGGLFETRVLAGGDFAASALKMAYAAVTKISSALVLAAHGAADECGVAAALVEEWAISQPGYVSGLAAARRSSAAKGWRWVGEMEQIAESFARAGQPRGFAEAAAEVFERFPRPDLPDL